MFSPKSFMVSGLMQYLIQSELILVYKVVVWFHSFACCCAVFPTPFIEDCPFLTLYSWLICNKLMNLVCVGYSWTLYAVPLTYVF